MAAASGVQPTAQPPAQQVETAMAAAARANDITASLADVRAQMQDVRNRVQECLTDRVKAMDVAVRLEQKVVELERDIIILKVGHADVHAMCNEMKARPATCSSSEPKRENDELQAAHP